MKNFRGKTVLITGSAGGIGRKLAIALAKEGAKLVFTDVKENDLNEAAEEARKAGATSAHAYPLDVTNTDAILAFRDKVHADVGPLDMLVNNAGVVFGGPFLEIPLERHLLTFKVNTMGPVAMTHTFLKDLVSKPEAHLVNIASASGFIGLPNGSTYAASKWSVIGFSESIRLELEQQGNGHVKVTTVCPSYIATGMFEGVKTPFMTPMLTPDGLVASMIAAIRRDDLFVLEPPLVRTLPILKGVLPQKAFYWVAQRLGVSSSMNSWKGHGK